MVDNYAELAKLYDNPIVLRTLDKIVDKYKDDSKICEWMDMLTKAKGFISSFYKDDLEAKVIYVLSGMFFNGEYSDESLSRLGNCNVSKVLNKLYSYPQLKNYIVVPIYLIAKGEADYERIALSLGNILKNPEIVKNLVEDILNKFE